MAAVTCLPPELYALLANGLGMTGTSAKQRSDLAAALEAYDVGTNKTAKGWRDSMVAALREGAFPNDAAAQLALVQFSSGQVGIEACP